MMARKDAAAPGKATRKPLTQRVATPKEDVIVPASARVFEVPRNVGGRPTKYDPQFAAQAGKLCRMGATDPELADFFEVGRATIHRWRFDHPEFAEAIRTGKAEVDDRVERTLLELATGYEIETVKIFMPAGADTPVYAKHREHVQPNVTAAIFWLKNRRREAWRDKQEVEHTGGIALNVTPEDAAL